MLEPRETDCADERVRHQGWTVGRTMTSPTSTESGWAMAKAIVWATACGGIAMASRRAVSDASSSGVARGGDEVGVGKARRDERSRTVGGVTTDRYGLPESPRTPLPVMVYASPAVIFFPVAVGVT